MTPSRVGIISKQCLETTTSGSHRCRTMGSCCIAEIFNAVHSHNNNNDDSQSTIMAVYANNMLIRQVQCLGLSANGQCYIVRRAVLEMMEFSIPREILHWNSAINAMPNKRMYDEIFRT